MKNNFTKKYSFLIGLIIFVLIIIRLDFNKLFIVLSNVKLIYLLFAVLLLFPILITKAYRWNYLKKKQRINYSLKESILMYGSGMYIGIITPGRIGDFSKISYLKNDNYSLGKSAVSVILDRIIDLLFLLFFGYLSLFLFFYFFKNLIFISTSILFLSLIIFIIILKSNFLKLFIKKIINLIIPNKYKESLRINFQDFINELKIYKTKDYLFVLLITIFSWIFYYFQAFILAKSININNISFLYLSICMTIVGLVNLLPISILGLGTRDAILILILSTFSINQEVIIGFSFLILLMAVLMGLICFFCWSIKPIQFSKN